MRKLMWFTLGFALACLAGAYLTSAGGLLAAAAVILVFGLVAVFRGRKGVRRGTLALLGCATGLAWCVAYGQLYLDIPAALDGVTQNAVLWTTDYSRPGNYGSTVEASLVVQGRRYQVWAYLREGLDLEPGQALAGQFRFRLTTSQGQEGATYHPGRGVFLLAYQAGDVTAEQGDGASDFPARARQKIREVLQACFPEDTYPFAKALVLGDTSDLDYETDTNLTLSGIRHVVAVSGLHVSVLFSVLCFVTRRKRILLALLGLPALGAFAALAGFTPSVTRACLMSGLMVVALVCGREYDGATALSFAVLVMLVLNPLAVTALSFQLSVGSVAGIFLFAERFRQRILDWLGGGKGRGLSSALARWFASGVSITLSAQLVTAPLCAYAFGVVSLIGVVTNLLTLWVVSFLFCGILAAVCVGFVWSAAGAAAGWVLSWPIRYVLAVAKILAKAPLGAVYTHSPYIVVWLVIVYGLVAVYFLGGQRRGLMLTCAGVMTLCLALLLSWVPPALDSARLTVLDVGQGQCLLLQNGGHTYMVDCGGDSDVTAADLAAGVLLSQGISRLDGLIVTHTDRDHAGAVENLLSRVAVDVLILPPTAGDLARETEALTVYAQEDLVLTWDTGTLTVYASPFRESSNESSLCVLFDTEKCDILITGDRSVWGEQALLNAVDLPHVDVLVAGHHGAADSTGMQLLQTVRPDIVCISAGRDNPYGHPAQQTLLRLLEFGCSIYRTDREGTIVIRR